jgi:predicted ATPase
MSRREILADGVPVELGGRNYDLLIALVETGGKVVSKDELMNRVWPKRIVEENNLQAGISALRKALGADRDLIRTVAGRGYQFTGVIQERGAQGQAKKTPTNLPAQAELVSREDLLAQLGQLIFEQRLITLCGAGGIGKTRLAIEAARRAAFRFPDGVWLADLAPLSEPSLVPAAVAGALGLPLNGAPVEAIADAVAAKHLLLVLDNCEHVIDAAARLADLLERKSSSIHILCTSREPLKVEAEWIYYVPPLEVPPEQAESLDDVLPAGAAQLFVLRARQTRPEFAVTIGQAATLSAICRRLDGMPLAIELAAARAAILGIGEVAVRLDDRFRLLAGGHRTALSRHQTLRATLDWSYELLPEPDRRALCRLAVFASAFSLGAAAALLAEQEDSAPEVVGNVTSLVEKSLLSVLGAEGTRYRMLETTRAYALEKLADRGEHERYSRRHAEYLRSVLKRAVEEWETLPEAAWSAAYCGLIDDARNALNWALTSSADPALAADLAVAMVPLWVQRSHMSEWRTQVERALDMLLTQSGAPDVRREMQLRAALGGALTFTVGPGPAMDAQLGRALEIAEQLDDSDYQLTSLLGLTARRIVSGELGAALPIARKYCAVVESRGRPAELSHSDNLMSYLLSWTGDQKGARHHIDRFNARPPSPIRRLATIGHQYAHSYTTAGRVLWLEGKPDQAMRFALDSLDEALAAGHALAICSLLSSVVCPIALLVGDLQETERCAALLQERARRNAMPYFEACGRAFAAAVLIRRGMFEPATTHMQEAIAELRRVNIALYEAILTAPWVEGLVGGGQVDQALSAIDDCIERSERTQARWYLPEQWRIKGELLLVQNRADAARQAEEWFQRSLELARSQGAVSWELRTTMSIAQLLLRKQQAARARKHLRAQLARFSEGFATADLSAAAALAEKI